ncbi:MAG: hypothetical protein RI925_2331, partial [Pseudomonadota bacterium]
MISFEFPIVERVRILLRLEELFRRLTHFSSADGADEHHVALQTLFDMAELGARGDLKSELIQDLERQRYALEALRDNPAIAEGALEAVLGEIESAMTRQLEFTGKFGHELRDNEWLMNIKQRTAIAGGACQFDLPSYYFWQKQSAEVRRADLQRWSAPLLATRDAVGVLLKLLRDSGKSNTFTARHGAFQQMSGGKVVHLIRITLDASLGLVPEVSANKYAVNVRFIEPTTHSARSRAATADIPFTL